MKKKNQIILLGIIGALILLFVISTGWFLYNNSRNNSVPVVTATTSDVTLSFKPNIVSAQNGKAVGASIFYDAGLNPTTNMTITITYDPKKLKNVAITPYKDPSSALSYSFEKDASLTQENSQNGTATLALKLVPGATAQKGKGIVARVTAIVISSPAAISLSPDSSAQNASTNLTLGRINLDITK